MKVKINSNKGNRLAFQSLLVFRVLLGLSLFMKGIQFTKQQVLLREMFAASEKLGEYFWLQTIIPWLNLIGGFLIVIGLFTRLSCLLNIPLLLGAVIFVNSKKGPFAGENELAYSVVVLVFLVFYLWEGAGPVSLDRWLRNKSGGAAM